MFFTSVYFRSSITRLSYDDKLLRSKEATVKETIAEEKVGFTNTVKETIAEELYCRGNCYKWECWVYYTVKETVTDKKVGFTIQSRKLLQMRRYGLLHSRGNCYRWGGRVYCTVEETVVEEKVGFTNTVKETIAEDKVGFTVQSRKLLQSRR